MNRVFAAALEPIRLSAILADYAELLKLRVNSLVVMTSCCGAYLAAGHSSFQGFVRVVVGIGAVAAGTAALNEVLERDVDGKMLRTARRPLVTGRIPIRLAVTLGVTLVAGGVLYLAALANILTGILALLTCLAYVLVYTPWKRFGPACTAIGAIPGAMPIVLGWTSAGGALDSRALALFSILYLWQFPHFHAIALLHREDYRRAGIQMLAVVDEGGRRIATPDSGVFDLVSCRQHNSLRFAFERHALPGLGFHFRDLASLTRDQALPCPAEVRQAKSCPQPSLTQGVSRLFARPAWSVSHVRYSLVGRSRLLEI